MSISTEEREAFARDGYFVRPGALPQGAADALTARLSELIERCAREHLSGARRTMAFWDVLRNSTGDASVMWDPSSGPMPSAASEWEPRAMRVGHGLHHADSLFGETVRGPDVGGVLAELIAPPAALVHSAVVYKQPRSSAVQFGLHQDAAYISTEPESLVLAFVALDDMDAENGALSVVPGSHMRERFVTLAMGPDGFYPVSGAPPREEDFRPVLLPMTRGSVAYVHGRVLHGSGPNRAPRPRRALIVHAISAAAALSPHSWVQPPPGGFERLIGSASSST